MVARAGARNFLLSRHSFVEEGGGGLGLGKTRRKTRRNSVPKRGEKGRSDAGEKHRQRHRQKHRQEQEKKLGGTGLEVRRATLLVRACSRAEWRWKGRWAAWSQKRKSGGAAQRSAAQTGRRGLCRRGREGRCCTLPHQAGGGSDRGRDSTGSKGRVPTPVQWHQITVCCSVWTLAAQARRWRATSRN